MYVCVLLTLVCVCFFFFLLFSPVLPHPMCLFLSFPPLTPHPVRHVSASGVLILLSPLSFFRFLTDAKLGKRIFLFVCLFFFFFSLSHYFWKCWFSFFFFSFFPFPLCPFFFFSPFRFMNEWQDESWGRGRLLVRRCTQRSNRDTVFFFFFGVSRQYFCTAYLLSSSIVRCKKKSASRYSEQ